MVLAPVVAMVDGLAPRPVALKFRRVTHAYYVSILEYSPPTIYPGQDSAHGGHTGTFLKRYVQKVKILTAPRNSIARLQLAPADGQKSANFCRDPNFL